MSPTTSRHGSFTIEREYRAAPARVYAAWSRPEAKARWFACHDDWVLLDHTMEFRVGGDEHLRVGPPGGPVHRFAGHYHDLVADRRIIYGYTMYIGDLRLSVSLLTVELQPRGAGTRLVLTEQAVFLDGHDDTLGDLAGREEGTRIGLENLAAVLDA